MYILFIFIDNRYRYIDIYYGLFVNVIIGEIFKLIFYFNNLIWYFN